MKLLESSVERGLYILLMLVFIVVGIYSFNIYQTNTRTHDILVNNCRIGNEFRQSNLALWNYILGLPPSTQQTSEQLKQKQDFQKFLDKTFMLRDCNNL